VSEASRSGFKVMTVLRGAALTGPAASANTTSVLRGPGPLASASAAAAGDTQETVYGVPVSAIKHCCGRGCKHCRIYWHRGKP
jgi:hypothetical protein